ncbi:MAG: acyl-CoA dehydratase activase [Desulfobacteraceae bacterium]|jgi:predicted CoA-substrate-specific enzyme activase|nr:acyl-CoA dehydratase activase [Desulfobacteraceae bacterium]
MKDGMVKTTQIVDVQAYEKTMSLGICLGASTISVVLVEANINGNQMGSAEKNNGTRVVDFSVHSHGGDPKQTLMSVVNELDFDIFDKIAVTGRKFHKFVNLSAISEPEAVEYAFKFVKPEDVVCPAVVSAGGETFMTYVLDSSGKISNVLTGNKCASGTGEFFLQQLRRMDVSLETIEDWTGNEKPYHVSGRCSVFCKSDCTHATNKGIPKSQVTAGLCVMMSNKVLELLKKVDRKNIMVTGGTALNKMMINNLKAEIPGLIVPEEAPYFEALGTALWALDHDTAPFPGKASLFRTEIEPFESLPPLSDFMDQVEFKTIKTDTAREGDNCILGLDVGSTTTKAVLLRKDDNAMLATIYLRTNGDPVGASRKCYESILEQVASEVDPAGIKITGLGVCGSGRQIAGLHAMTDGVINEIIAHAAAAVFFDDKVDTIFEIGGQDAKYTYITNGVSSDYAMNEACSAGTGSFLEESAHESLNVAMEDIADIAMKGKRPPNFNDQCAAFISSDIKNAIHEGVAHEDIIAGLVYSICMNYSNRVKGNRQVGEKIFMQGGVCYNHAIPLAMAALVGKPIIVPPEPGLMGAFGVALEVKKRIENNFLAEGLFDLKSLAAREVKYGKSFICGGGKEKCDRKCHIAMIELEGEKYPFGGACNRYYNLRRNIAYDIKSLDLVKLRQSLVFDKYAAALPEKTTPKGRVWINRSFLVNTYYPLYSTFFTELGYELILPDEPSQEGIDRRGAAFCYPAELAHGFFYSLIEADDPPDFIFLPHFKTVPSISGDASSQLCPFVQGETFFLQTTFRDSIKKLKAKGTQVLTPLLDLRKGLETAVDAFVETAAKMGEAKNKAVSAFKKAVCTQNACLKEMTEIGKQVMADLESDPDRTAMVIFARSYNGYVEEANMGIPHKLVSRGVQVIPIDFLSLEEERDKKHMYWGMGQRILKAARLVKKHPQLFGTYITNFSCGPDSFLVGYFRSIMGKKPSLTLELDSHSADAGIETRIEAYLDIVATFRQLEEQENIPDRVIPYRASGISLENGIPMVTTSSGKTIPMTDPAVTILFPSLGLFATKALGAVFQSKGYNTFVHPPSDDAILKLGRANTSCKECLPLLLTTGSLLNYIQNHKKDGEIVVYFMPTGSGPCRFGQYYVFMEDLIKRLNIPDVALLSLSSENSYAGLGNDFQIKAWWAVIVSDVMEDIRSMILANAKDVNEAMDLLEKEWGRILKSLETENFAGLENQLQKSSWNLGEIPMKRPPEEMPMISLSGEMFVRRDGLSRRYLTEVLAKRGFATVCAPIAEWIIYSDYLVDKNLVYMSMTLLEKLGFMIKKRVMAKHEKRLKALLRKSGLTHAEVVDMDTIIETARPYVSPNLTGEVVLTVGSAITEVAIQACGVIAIGPFGCMPNRMSEAILNETMNRTDKLATAPKDMRLKSILKDVEDLPFLAIESDGSPFPQVIHAKLEAFCLRAERLHDQMMQSR